MTADPHAASDPRSSREADAADAAEPAGPRPAGAGAARTSTPPSDAAGSGAFAGSDGSGDTRSAAPTRSAVPTGSAASASTRASVSSGASAAPTAPTAPTAPGASAASAGSGEAPAHPDAPPQWRRGHIKAEILIVLALSLGASAVYSIVSLVNKATTPQGVAGQVSRLNTSLSDRPIFDLIYQVLAVVFDFAPVALVLFLLWEPTRSAFRRLGFDIARWRTDLKWVGILILAIGIPGLAFFGVSRLLGLNAAISTNGLSDYWWTPLILILRALDAGVVEEVIVVGYLFTRLRELKWAPWAIILTSAALRGSYHLYQGYGAFVGNFVMGVAFGLLYQRYGRIMPLVIAHTIFDMIAFLGYPLALLWFPGVFA